MKKAINWILYSFPGSYNVLSKISQGLGGLFKVDLAKEKVLTEKYFNDLTVINGPCKGIRYKEYHSGIMIPAKLAGGYEKYIYKRIQRAIDKKYDTLINVGSAEGYYAIGIAKALPDMKVYAFDTAPECQKMCNDLKEINNCANVHIYGEFKLKDIGSYMHGKTLLLCDIEGGEVSLLNPDNSNELQHIDILVECHDFLHNGIMETLLDRFYMTHDIEIIKFQPLTSALYEKEKQLYGADFESIMNENRAVDDQKWLMMTAKA